MDEVADPKGLPPPLLAASDGSSPARSKSDRGRDGKLIYHPSKDRLVRTSGGLMLLTILNSGFGYLYWTAAARLFPPQQVGAASAVITAAMLTALLCDFGVRTFVMQQLPTRREATSWSSYVTTCLLTCTVLAAVGGAVACLALGGAFAEIRGFLQSWWALAFVLLVVATAQMNLVDGIAIAERRPLALIRRNTMTGALKVLVLLVLGVLIGLPWHSVVVAALVAAAVGAGYGIIIQLRAFQPDWRFTASGAVRLLRASSRGMISHHALNLGGQIPMYVMPLEVVAQLTTRDNAYMSLTWLVAGAFFLVSPAVSNALFVEGRWTPDSLHGATVKAAKLIGCLIGPLILFMVVFGRWVLGLVGRSYAENGYALLCILAVSAIPDAYTNIWLARFRARGTLVTGAILNWVMALVAVIGTWFTLPMWGITAVGWCWGGAQFVGCLLSPVMARLQRTKTAAS